MQRIRQRHFAALLACYITGWLCVAPSLVMCICAEHQATLTSLVHESAACEHDHSEHSHGPLNQNDSSQPSQNGSDHPDHSDRPLFDDHARVDQATPFSLEFTPVTFLNWNMTGDADATGWMRNVITPVHGPPRATDLSLRSVILLT